MSSLQNQVKKLKYDRRLLSLSLKIGDITKEEFEKYLKTLEDCSDRAKNMKIQEVEEESSSN